MLDLVVRGGEVVTPHGRILVDVGVHDGRIATLSVQDGRGEARREIDATGLLVLPGLVDPHVHLGHRVLLENEWVIAADDFSSGTRSAAVGGNTCVIDFALQRKLDPASTLAARKADCADKAIIDYSFHVVLTRSERATGDAIAAVVNAGVPSFKLYLIYRKQGRMADDGLLFNTLVEASRTGAIVGVHAENAAIAEYNTASLLEQGATSPVDFARSKPNHVEAEAINRVIFLAEHVGAAVYIFHLSTREGAELVARARARGVRVHAETCMHYLLLTESCYAGVDGHRYICSPPLRTARDVDALWRGIVDRTIGVVSSDHCGFSTAAKERGSSDFTRAPNGLPGVTLRLPLLFTHGVAAGRIRVEDLVALLSTNPARLFGLYPRKGAILPGSDADLVLVDPARRKTVRADDLDSRVDWSPYEGTELLGWPVLTIFRGEVVAQDGKCVTTLARGRFLERQPSPNTER
jgi:dihydropyrimidinase